MHSGAIAARIIVATAPLGAMRVMSLGSSTSRSRLSVKASVSGSAAVSSAGSFADWYQGIVMFGDPSQVPRILTICILALTAVVLLIITGFMGFGKQET